MGIEKIENKNFEIEFHWIQIKDMENIQVYPTNTPELLKKMDEGVKHFVYKQNE